MKAPVKLGLYGAILAVVFAVSAVTANLVVPEETVQRWTEQIEQGEQHGGPHAENTDDDAEDNDAENDHGDDDEHE